MEAAAAALLGSPSALGSAAHVAVLSEATASLDAGCGALPLLRQCPSIGQLLVDSVAFVRSRPLDACSMGGQPLLSALVSLLTHLATTTVSGTGGSGDGTAALSYLQQWACGLLQALATVTPSSSARLPLEHPLSATSVSAALLAAPAAATRAALCAASTHAVTGSEATWCAAAAQDRKLLKRALHSAPTRGASTTAADGSTTLDATLWAVLWGSSEPPHCLPHVFFPKLGVHERYELFLAMPGAFDKALAALAVNAAEAAGALPESLGEPLWLALNALAELGACYTVFHRRTLAFFQALAAAGSSLPHFVRAVTTYYWRAVACAVAATGANAGTTLLPIRLSAIAQTHFSSRRPCMESLTFGPAELAAAVAADTHAACDSVSRFEVQVALSALVDANSRLFCDPGGAALLVRGAGESDHAHETLFFERVVSSTSLAEWPALFAEVPESLRRSSLFWRLVLGHFIAQFADSCQPGREVFGAGAATLQRISHAVDGLEPLPLLAEAHYLAGMYLAGSAVEPRARAQLSEVRATVAALLQT
eukprot:m.285621 g.285621  ORF g.285621 m.285621 type:complete len:539 (+) comp11416_c0_seq1:1367-2983(+)